MFESLEGYKLIFKIHVKNLVHLNIYTIFLLWKELFFSFQYETWIYKCI